MASQVTSAVELRRRYAEGERDFHGAKIGLSIPMRDGESGTDLQSADLTGVNLSGANLMGVNLSMSKLTGANLQQANFTGANLNTANLTGAHLNGAHIIAASLMGTRLAEAQLLGTQLHGVNLTGAKLAGANFWKAHINNLVLADVELGSLCRADIYQNGPSTVDYRSILRSLNEPNLAQFLRDSGMPNVFVEYNIACAKSMNPSMVFSLLQSTFISYGGPDEAFARRLNEALKAEGVTTFFFTDDAVPGEELHAMMRRGVNEFDRVILVCSETSLNRKGLLNEIKETLRREARDGGRSYLIPVVLDNYLFDGWKPSDPGLAREAVTDRVAADFRRTAEFKAGIAKLVRALKKPETAP